MHQAERRQSLLLGVASGAVLASLVVIPLAFVFDSGQAVRTGEPVAVATTAAPSGDGSSFDPALAAQGELLFANTCTVCHGPDALGITGLGKTLVGSEFVNGSTNQELVAFLNVGRPIEDPANTTGIAMPPKGANPTLTDDDLNAIINYIRSLN